MTENCIHTHIVCARVYGGEFKNVQRQAFYSTPSLYYYTLSDPLS